MIGMTGWKGEIGQNEPICVYFQSANFPEMSLKSIIASLVLIVMASNMCFAQPTQSQTQDTKKKKSQLSRYRSSNASDDLLNEAEKEASKNPESALDKVQEALAES